jgi:hypothetical protein
MIFNPFFKANFSSHLFIYPKMHSIIHRKTMRCEDSARYIGFLFSDFGF